MGRERKQAEPEGDAGAPEWMVTFSDCMTLLLTFFVLLLSFSSFDTRIFRRLKVVYSEALTSIAPSRRSDRDALWFQPQIRYIIELDKGSEKPTLVQGLMDGLLKKTGLVDLQSGMTFLISSKKLFWGEGTTLSPNGCRIMDTLASFLRELTSLIVVSENGPVGNQSSEYLGLPRAWVVMEYLTTKQNLDRRRFNISAAGTLVQGNFGGSKPDTGRREPERTVEIVLLERSIYN